MGREADCICSWGGASAHVKVLLETGELLLRGEIRRRVPFIGMHHVQTQGEALVFRYCDEDISLALGHATAEKWCKVIATPPPSLAAKLGITPETIVWVLGEVDDAALATALAVAGDRASRNASLIVACVDSPQQLAQTLRTTSNLVRKGVPLWLIYPKGKGHQVGEASVLSSARDTGLIDTKVASVSARYTGLRFIVRKQLPPPTPPGIVAARRQ